MHNMAQQNIQYGGMRHAPSDITGKDGDLLDCVNMINEGGELKPLELPEGIGLDLKKNETLAFVHNPVGAKNLIVVGRYLNRTMIRAMKLDGSVVQIDGEAYHYIIEEEVRWVNAVGNTLVVGTDKSVNYAIYKVGQNSYTWLGNELPRPVFEVCITSAENDEYFGEFEPNPPCVWEENIYGTNIFGQSNSNNVTQTSGEPVPGGGMPMYIADLSGQQYNSIRRILPADMDTYKVTESTGHNSIVLKENIEAKYTALLRRVKKANLFLSPFFVRYALRLFDGSYACHSTPLLMMPSTQVPIVSYWQQLDIKYNCVTFNIALAAKGKRLKYIFKGFFKEDGSDVTLSIHDWDDIILGVDLFLSSETEIINMDETLSMQRLNYTSGTKWRHDLSNYNTGYGYYDNEKHLVSDDIKGAVPYQSSGGWEKNKTGLPNSVWYFFYFDFIAKSTSQLKNELESKHIFYFAKGYSLEKLQAGVTHYFDKDADNETLVHLESNKTLPDDYVSLFQKNASIAYNYNKKITLGNVGLRLPLWNYDFPVFQNNTMEIVLLFEINKNGKIVYIRKSGRVGVYSLHHLYYPDVNCKKISIAISTNNYTNWHYKTYSTTPHPYLNGAYVVADDFLKTILEEVYVSGNTCGHSELPFPQTSSDRWYKLPNTIAMSNVANPFVFEAKNFVNVGRAEITDIAANTLDVSSGQWGSYPLHVFCKDGIVALGINDKGEFNGSQAVSADVLIEPQGISRPTVVQTGQMLVFLTSRGLMALAGTEIKPLSLVMNGRHFNTTKELQGTANLNIGSFGQLVKKASDDTAFREYAKEGFLAYDYTHNRVLLCHPEKEYQYVLSLDTMLWSKEVIYWVRGEEELPTQQHIIYPVNVTGAVNDYTELYLQGDSGENGNIYKTMNVTEENVEGALHQYGYFVSRPVRLGTDEYKTIKRMLHRYTHYNKDSFVRMMLYGSRDGMNYGRINTLRGMSWQYFIIVVYCYMKPNERYSYTSIDFETRLTNKLR